MACTTCDHTMQCVVPDVFWCPRCGTLKAGGEFEKPKLPARVKKLLALVDNPEVTSVAHSTGVLESIMVRVKKEPCVIDED